MTFPAVAHEPLMDRGRMSSILKRANLDALILSRSENIYYATGQWPALSRMGQTSSALAVVPRDSTVPIAYVCLLFSYYYTVADTGLDSAVEPYLVTWEDGADAAPAQLFLRREGDGLTPREENRREAIAAAGPCFASMAKALSACLNSRGLATAKLGFDALEALETGQAAAPRATFTNAVNIPKSARLVKSPSEIALMATASKANVAASLHVAQQMRSLRTLKNIRTAFKAEASRLGNTPVFMAVDGVIAEDYDDLLLDGTSVLIDCVSQHAGYHGDYGRTVFIGEPNARLTKTANAIGAAWDALRDALRPGMSFSEISARGGELLAQMGCDYRVPFGPHSVGLAHTDQPLANVDGGVLDIVLEPGMIISVDCPLMEASLMGTMHLEDLTVITESGSRPLHDIGHQTIIA